MFKSTAALILPLFLLLGCSDKSKVIEADIATPAEPSHDEVSHDPAAHGESSKEEASPQDSAAGLDLMKPSTLNKTAPATYKVKFETSKGEFVIQVHRDWAPLGADRFYNLVLAGFYNDTAFFRALDGFMAQFGINGDPAVNAVWMGASIQDDPKGQSNTAGRLTFAMGGPNTRTTQMFINFGNNPQLDNMGFPPIGEVISGMENVNSIYTGYGEGAPQGRGPSQQFTQTKGNAYLRESFPKLDYIQKVSVVQ